MCENGKEYTACGTNCPAKCYYATTKESFCDVQICHEGCACREGFVLESKYSYIYCDLSLMMA